MKKRTVKQRNKAYLDNYRECNLIREPSQDGKNLWLSGIFMQAEMKNSNGRSRLYS